MHTVIYSISKSVVNWLHDFLTVRGFGSVQNKPLYQYHLTTNEYRSLRKTLTESQRFDSNNSFSTEWCAAFTLYGAEWFRREYSGDWSWQPIFKSLGFELTPSQISNVIPKGLVRFWHRPLSKFGSSNNNDYIGSMFREGGLPSNLLSSESSHYKDAFFSVFERYQYAKDIGANAIDRLIRSRIGGLPETLQSDDSVELIANMVDKLDKLVYQFSLYTQNEPAKYLDAQYPRWRESFPLPLESETGSAFLSQLL
ncbi:MAG: STY4851/ECs_5259 family protein, partial [Shewanella sp.]